MGMNTETYPDGTPRASTEYAVNDVAAARYNTDDQRTLGQLFGELSTDLSDLIRKEVMLAQAETTEKVTKIAKGAGMAAAGGFVAYAGFVVLLIALAFLLDLWLDRFWLSAAIIAILTLVLGVILLQAGRSKLKNTDLKPEQTIDSLKENVEWAKEQTR